MEVVSNIENLDLRKICSRISRFPPIFFEQDTGNITWLAAKHRYPEVTDAVRNACQYD